MFVFINIPEKVRFSKTKTNQVSSDLKNAKIAAKRVEFEESASAASKSQLLEKSGKSL